MKKRIITLIFAVLLMVTMTVSVFATDDSVITIGALSERLYDGADILTDSEEAEIASRLDVLSEKYKVDFVVATVSEVGDYTPTEYCEAYYDDGGYGIGDDRSGVLLFIAMDDGEGKGAYRIHSRGFAEVALTEDEQISIGESCATFLTAEEYASAIDSFIDDCEYQIDGEINGFPFEFGFNLVVSIVIGLVIAFIVTGIWKGQLKSVRQQTGAANYTKPGSMQITQANDFFLYRTITREKKPEKSSSSSNSSSGGGRTTGGSF